MSKKVVALRCIRRAKMLDSGAKVWIETQGKVTTIVK
jgi:hypothetical protein